MDDVVADLKVMKIKQWMEKMKDREKWRLIVEEAKAHPGPRKEGRINHSQVPQHAVHKEHAMGYLKKSWVVLLTTKKAGYRKISYVLGTRKK